MKVETLKAECTAYDFKVTLEEKRPKSWLKSVSAFVSSIESTPTLICYLVNDRLNSAV